MSPPDDSRPAAPGEAPTPASSPSAGRFAELLAGMAPLERIERLAVVETLSYGTVYEGRVFRASRAEPVSLLELDQGLEAGSAYPPILRNLLAAARIRGSHILSPRGLYRDVDALYALYDAQPGLSLATGFDYLQRNGLRLTAEAVLRIASDILQALDELEREDAGAGGSGERLRCHGLLVPENLFVTEDQRVVVRGIGIWQSGIAKTGRLGPRERRYLAPLQSAQGTASARSDLISLGAILFEAAAGFPAFDVPPSEEDLAELIVRIDEIGAKADAARRELFSIAHACLSAMAVTLASRGRLRVTVDTMFLRAASVERAAGYISLEDLAGKVKAARPAIVKAVALDLDPVETPLKPPPLPARAPEPVSPPPADGPTPNTASLSNAPPPGAASSSTGASLPALPAKPRFEIHLSQVAAIRILAGVVTVILAAGVFLLSRPRPAHREDAVDLVEPAAPPETTAPAGNAALPKSPDAGAETSAGASAATPGLVPTVDASAEEAGQRAAALAAPVRPAGELSPGASAGTSTSPPAAIPPAGIPARSSREAERRKPAARPTARPSRVRAAPSSAAAEPAPAPEAPSLPAVAPGTLVDLGAPGLVLPAVTDRPEDLRFSPEDPRPASPGSVQLQLLVDERGRVLDHRILGATRFPPGISSGVARYIAALRFRPAELRGVPVRVWIRHDMRFLAP